MWLYSRINTDLNMSITQLSSSNLLEQVHYICDSDKPCIVVLSSMNVYLRDRWARAINTPYYWAHSMRVIRHIKNRFNKECHESETITIDSVYNVIYGGVDTDSKDWSENVYDNQNDDVEDDGCQVVIPV